MSETLVFAQEGQKDDGRRGGEGEPWKVMIVDDQEDIHNITRLVLGDFAFEGRDVVCLSARSGVEAREMISRHPDVAVILLDVVMETSRAGLDVARFIRDEIANRFVRIILRTGQPGEAPEREVVTELDINDYRQKTELTADRLVTAVTTAIRSYRDLKIIDEGRRGLHLLAMSVAHQIRNRTTTIAGFANLIRKKGSASSDVAAHLTTIMEESERLESMVSDVTGYASTVLGELTPVNVREALETVMGDVDAELAASGRSVQWDVLCPDQTIRVDPSLFHKALKAVLQNGVDFSGDEAWIGVQVSPGRSACVIEIADHGGGIAEEHMPFIFDPFFSVKPEGSGMGLCVARKVAMEHQWDLEVLNHPGAGVTVRIVIPRRDMTGLRGEGAAEQRP